MSRAIKILFRVQSVHGKGEHKSGKKKPKPFRDRAATTCEEESSVTSSSLDGLLHKAPRLPDLRPEPSQQLLCQPAAGLSVSCEVLGHCTAEGSEGPAEVNVEVKVGGDFRRRAVVISYRCKSEYYTTLRKSSSQWELCDELLPEFERRLTIHFPRRKSEPFISSKLS